ncbi:sigma-54 interaction domain-containing protein [Thermanaeromonas sp. C210]|uniref:sigma-54 interaction domain-containing protein n=1 Tax=Thermanaeromonas sp. C210 TaxID=2731925 RepID=UPI00155B527A|nr:sigma 54-interacting transcriptional regulator [Thermanaeromonas sp. C210]GFN23496.1 sigma-54-dependent Fis family transcriptional regulator [Thermanaeromonas sp. C210]
MKSLENLLSCVSLTTSRLSRARISLLKETVRKQRDLAEQIRRLKHEVVYRGAEDCDLSLVRAEVVRSWIRSKKYGLETSCFYYGPVLENSVLRGLLEEKRLLLKAADGYLERLVEMFSNRRSSVLLSDENGIMLRVLHSEDGSTRRRIRERLRLVPGSVWTEATVGTCSHVLCTLHQEPIQLWGPEHYSDVGWDQITCSSAPIFDAAGNLAGTLSIGADCYLRQNPYALGMAISAAWAIQNRLQNLERTEQRSFLEKAESGLQAYFITNRQGVITQANDKARAVLVGVGKELVGQPFEVLLGKQPVIEAVLQRGEAFEDVELRLEESDRVLAGCSALPIKDGAGKIYGCLVTLGGAKQNGRRTGIPETRRDSGTSGMAWVLKDRENGSGFESLVGSSPALLQTIEVSRKAALSSANILLQGESGVGKEVFARCIHNLSRPWGPFVAVNCAALPKSLIESELFGYEGGAFTGADRKGRPGKIELAHGGTLFLDEISDMPLEIQPVLLRVLEEKQFMRVGGSRPVRVDFRLIAATNRDLLELTRKQEFRLDLYYRIAVFKIIIPPLRERGLDILELARYFIMAIARREGLPAPALSREAEEILLTYDWPGNVRQLENAMLYAMTMCRRGIIYPEDLPAEIREGGRTEDGGSVGGRPGMVIGAGGSGEDQAAEKALEVRPLPMKELEKRAIKQALAQTNYNVRKAAALLGLGQSTLYRKIRDYNLSKG